MPSLKVTMEDNRQKETPREQNQRLWRAMDRGVSQKKQKQLLEPHMVVQMLKASDYNEGDLGSIPGSGRSPGEGNGNPLQYSCLENPMDGEAW